MNTAIGWDADFEIGALGDQVAQEILAADAGLPGLDAKFAAGALSELFSRGAQTYEQKQAEAKSRTDSAAALKTATDAVNSYVNAEANYALIEQSKDTSRITAAGLLRDSARQRLTTAAARVSPDDQAKMLKVAQDASDKAAQESLASPKDAAKAAKMAAWQKVIDLLQSGPPDVGKKGGGGGSRDSGGGSFVEFLKKRRAGAPTWAWGLGGIAVVGTVIYIARRRRK